MTGGRSSNSGDPGEGCSATFALCLVGVSRISLKKKKKISDEDQTWTNTNISLSLVTGARRLFLALTGYALGKILLSTWSKSTRRKKGRNSPRRCTSWRGFLSECLRRRLCRCFRARFGPKYDGFKFKAKKMKVVINTHLAVLVDGIVGKRWDV